MNVLKEYGYHGSKINKMFKKIAEYYNLSTATKTNYKYSR